MPIPTAVIDGSPKDEPASVARPGRIARALVPALAAFLAALTPLPAHAQAAPTCAIGPLIGEPVARHEAGFIAHDGKLYLLGGRGVRQVSIFDPEARRWENGAFVPLELHHFQPVVVEDEIWIVGAMTGRWPNETPVTHVWRYLPKEDRFERGIALPEGRLRGGGGVVNYGGRIWWAGGITHGHVSGTVGWLDSYDLEAQEWERHPDMPNPRDHWQMVATGNRLFAAGGRNTGLDAENYFEPTIAQGDIYDIASDSWLPTDPAFTIPTPRAGLMAAVVDGQLVYVGGESGSQATAHAEVEVYDLSTRSWRSMPPLARGRHGSGLPLVGDRFYVASGSGNQGGSPELTSTECLAAPSRMPEHVELYHPLGLDFLGPPSGERASPNPFTDYRLVVSFAGPGDHAPVSVRGFYAADGDAADSSAKSGNTWRALFTPDRAGNWSWTARLSRGVDIAVDRDVASGETIPLAVSRGSFVVGPSSSTGVDWRAPENGPLIAREGKLLRSGSGAAWLKSGTNSPENLLGYVGFDGTYRMVANAREGEATVGETLHGYAAHEGDWSNGDPQWQHQRGRSLVGAMNYLASRGVNSSYFLTWNVEGDGKDVWPYLDPNDQTRFDVSKLAQWDRLFEHMQERGIALHIVLQEAENQLLMDGGDTGRIRKLYLAEMVARFGHHNALFWNLGEENGPFRLRPEAQNDAQRKAMIDWLSAIDPYGHPVLLHTHSRPEEKDSILRPLLGYPGLDGLSLQVSDPAAVHGETLKWLRLSRESGTPWVLTMDEIGPWYDGAVPDDEATDNHASLVRDALWGHLLAGGSGVEWYFGARHKHNDLTAEDFRTRDNLWKASSAARELAADVFDLATTRPCPTELAEQQCLIGTRRDRSGTAAMLYLVAGQENPLWLDSQGVEITWRDPLDAGTEIGMDTGSDRIAVASLPAASAQEK